MKIQEVINQAIQNGFEEYSDSPHPDKFEYPDANCLFMTCTEGEFDGEVVDVIYNFRNGNVISHSVYSQFKGQNSKFKLP